MVRPACLTLPADHDQGPLTLRAEPGPESAGILRLLAARGPGTRQTDPAVTG
ncbi:hypothetical protein OG204_23965 [Streptomyces sp. NBC_01387]|uniref:hypothetical protein n=1 Tax=unclassified Streptomyces TaxID=2593676 RepID=UPI002023FFD5|nr:MULTISPECIES: hypothetical protein [unclassified Streptomyces]MCX4548621.1 hypothetical protein [Streptomyces sp. NBC_01500]WSC20230.1 hypothetical protein OIE60_11315 [Streptomyces sp. NBC_01766]WSV54254.1 hypothetical protein OG282_11295 [Streptomyces sp. NBC_01014]